MLFVAPLISEAQGEYNVWHFGKFVGVDFNSGSPVAISGPISTDEGTACICDASGNLLFSTDGETVYKSNGTVMGTGLWGSFTSTQSAIIIPKPGSTSIYYIFTSDGWGGGVDGISYSIVDMNLGGGLGALTSINNQLIAPACEKLTAIRHGNGTDFWVIARKYPEGDYYSYPVTAAGVGNPVISSVGASIVNNYNLIGYMVSSPDGHKIASTIYYNDPYSFELFDFSVSSGVLSNAVGIADTFGYYGACFSPDGSKLYMSRCQTDTVRMVQYDLTAGNILNSAYYIKATAGLLQGGLQLGPDGKIYSVTNGDKYLDAINNPNLAGAACNFQDSAVLLSGTFYCRYGLPNNFQTLFYSGGCQVDLGSGASLLCTGNGAVTLNPGSGFTNYHWSTGQTTQTISVSTIGDYAVTVTTSQGCTASDTITVAQPPPAVYSVVSQTDSLPCSSTTGGHINLDVTLGTPPYHYQWSNNATTQDLNNIPLGNYSVTITDNAGCITVSDTFHITLINSLQLNGVVTDVTGCYGNTNGSIQLNYSGNGGSPFISWSPMQGGLFFNTIYSISAGIYTVTAYDSYGCIDVDTFVLNQPAPIIPSIVSQTDSLECVEGSSGHIEIDVSGGTAPYTYLWNNGFPAEDMYSLNAGTYVVTITDNAGCTMVSDSITIVQINNLIITNNTSTIILCNGDNNGSIDLQILNGLFGPQFIWSNGETTEDLFNLAPGSYSVTVIDSSGCVAADTFNITEPTAMTAILNIINDTIFCNASGGTPASVYHYLWSTGATTSFITNATNGTYTVTVSDINNCTALASVVISEVVSINEEGDFFIYPNPVSSQLMIDNGQLTINELQITDVLGRVVQSFEFKVQSPVTVTVSDFSEGVYFIKLVSSSCITEVKKFVVVH